MIAVGLLLLLSNYSVALCTLLADKSQAIIKDGSKLRWACCTAFL
jgi:hypothetical protein